MKIASERSFSVTFVSGARPLGVPCHESMPPIRVTCSVYPKGGGLLRLLSFLGTSPGSLHSNFLLFPACHRWPDPWRTAASWPPSSHHPAVLARSCSRWARNSPPTIGGGVSCA